MVCMNSQQTISTAIKMAICTVCSRMTNITIIISHDIFLFFCLHVCMEDVAFQQSDPFLQVVWRLPASKDILLQVALVLQQLSVGHVRRLQHHMSMCQQLLMQWVTIQYLWLGIRVQVGGEVRSACVYLELPLM